MTQDALTDVENVEKELAELHAQLLASIPILSTLNEIPGQFADLAERCNTMNAAAAAAQAQAHLLLMTRTAQEERFAQLMEESSKHEQSLAEQWQSFRTMAEAEQNQVMRVSMTTRQELTERAVGQEKIVASLDERLEKMNLALTNMVTDLHNAQRKQKITAVLVTALALLTLALSAIASWYAFF